MHRITIQRTISLEHVDQADFAALAKEFGKSANSLTWLKELQSALP